MMNETEVLRPAASEADTSAAGATSKKKSLIRDADIVSL